MFLDPRREKCFPWQIQESHRAESYHRCSPTFTSPHLTRGCQKPDLIWFDMRITSSLCARPRSKLGQHTVLQRVFWIKICALSFMNSGMKIQKLELPSILRVSLFWDSIFKGDEQLPALSRLRNSTGKFRQLRTIGRDKIF